MDAMTYDDELKRLYVMKDTETGKTGTPKFLTANDVMIRNWDLRQAGIPVQWVEASAPEESR